MTSILLTRLTFYCPINIKSERIEKIYFLEKWSEVVCYLFCISFAGFQIKKKFCSVCYTNLKVMIIQQRLQNIIFTEQQVCTILQLFTSKIIFHKTTILMNQKQ